MEFASVEARRWVLALHGVHIRKFLVATNVAETSVTTDDVGVVINSGRMKEIEFDGVRLMASLVDVVISRATHASDVVVRDVWVLELCVHLVISWLPWELQPRALC